MSAEDWQLQIEFQHNATLFSLFKNQESRIHFHHFLGPASPPLPPQPRSKAMSLTPLMFRSLVRLLTALIGEPAASVSTLLYYSDLLPQNIVLLRLVRHELLDEENYLFHFLVNFLRCFW